MLNNAKIIAFGATSNSKNSRAFYERILALNCVEDNEYATVYDCNGTMLRIQNVEEVLPQPYTMMGWWVKDINAEVANLKSRGVKFEIYSGMNSLSNPVWNAPSGAYVAWFKDPDGNTLSLTQL